MLRSMLLFTLIFAGCLTMQVASASERGSECDKFSLDDYEVVVKFYDPIDVFKLRYPKFNHRSSDTSDKEKIDKWVECLRSSTLYLFTVKDRNGNVKKHFCMRGNPAIRNSARYYEVAVVSAEAPALFDPNGTDYSQLVERTVHNFPASGQLFEHMKLFDDPSQKQYIGNGVKFFGVYVRVMPYDEVKKGMTKIIREELKV